MTSNLTPSRRQLLRRSRARLGWVPIRCPLVTFHAKAMCAFLCVFGKKNKNKTTHWLVPKDFRALLTRLFLPVRNLVVCLHFLCLLLPFNVSQVPVSCQASCVPSPGLTRQARQEAVGLVAFSAVTSLPPGMT